MNIVKKKKKEKKEKEKKKVKKRKGNEKKEKEKEEMQKEELFLSVYCFLLHSSLEDQFLRSKRRAHEQNSKKDRARTSPFSRGKYRYDSAISISNLIFLFDCMQFIR